MYVPTYYYSVALLLLGAVILRASRQATTLSAECPGTETSRGWLATSGGGPSTAPKPRYQVIGGFG